MPETAHLWAIGFDDLDGAERLRNRITSLADPVQHLLLLDLAVLVRNADGSFVLDRQPFPAAGNVLCGGPLGFLAGIALAVPWLTNAVVGELLGLPGSSISKEVGISDTFTREVEAMLRPGTSALLMLDVVGNLDESLRELRGMGGTILKTNVDVDRVKLLQSTLQANSKKLFGTADERG